jgi:SAM-dependent methyltransferase
VSNTVTDYTTVTEVPGNLVSHESLEMVWTRYAFAGQLCAGKSVLEVACGPGPGLGYLSARCRSVVGGDYTAAHLTLARSHYGPRIPLVQLDAHTLPFRPRIFEAVILFEAIYFLARPDLVIDACRAALRDDGLLIIASVNPTWPGFNPAPFSTRYLTARELEDLLRSHGFSAEIYGGFPDADESWRRRVLGVARHVAVRLRLIPKTMKGKEFLKRLAFGKLHPFPAEVSAATAACREPVRLSDLNAGGRFKVLYAVGQKRAGGEKLS